MTPLEHLKSHAARMRIAADGARKEQCVLERRAKDLDAEAQQYEDAAKILEGKAS